jgi:hypothetical protein
LKTSRADHEGINGETDLGPGTDVVKGKARVTETDQTVAGGSTNAVAPSPGGTKIENDTGDYSATKAPENRKHVESEATDPSRRPGGTMGVSADVGMSALNRPDDESD